MKTPKRYSELLNWKNDFEIVEHPDGEYVLYSDYAALVQQGIRDHGDWRSKLNFLETDYKAEVARLTAENERLRKAGDAMQNVILNGGSAIQHLVAWNAAKEGRDAK